MTDDDDLVRAAGGLVLRRGEDDAAEVLIVHRPKYGDWSYPKGKLHEDESFADGARREVEEETGYSVEMGRELPEIRYRDPRYRPKVVRYWIMTPVDGGFEPNPEVDEIRWVSLGDAAVELSYQHDRELLDEIRPDDLP